MSPLVHGFTAGFIAGAVGLVCVVVYLGQRWGERPPECDRCARRAREARGPKRSYTELEELHAVAGLLAFSITSPSLAKPKVLAANAQLFEQLERLAVARLARDGGNAEDDARCRLAALERARRKIREARTPS